MWTKEPQATGSKHEGLLCLTWVEELELPRAEPKELAWSMAAACTSELSAALAGELEPRQTFQLLHVTKGIIIVQPN